MQKEPEYQICVRIRRDKSTFVFTCTPQEGIQALKKKVIQFQKGLEVGDIRLFHEGKLLDDKSNIHDQGIKNNSLIYFRMKKGQTGDWEEIPEIVF